ncbi:hypothetical protein BD779DRAFT_1803989 [Infundibulicybe gibba]|nr:hypothetical protein BD779DRAFT_1803989 [Infundibulicybe gibba]
MNRQLLGTSTRYYPDKIVVHDYYNGGRRTTTYPNKQQERFSAGRRSTVRGMSQADRDVVEQTDIDLYEAAVDAAVESLLPPPGERGCVIRYGNGKQAVKGSAPGFNATTGRYKSIDNRTRTDRVKIQNEYWARQWDQLVDAYLAYRAKDYGDGLPPQNDSAPPSDPEGDYYIMDAVDIFSWRRPTFLPITGETWANETLIRYGYIGSAPLLPSLAISIRTLEAYHESHQLCPQFSMAAQCKALCSINDVPYSKYLAVQFKTAYNAYLEICHRVEAQGNTELSGNRPNDKAPSAGPSGPPARRQRSEDPDSSDDSDALAPNAPNKRKRRASSPGSDDSETNETQHRAKHSGKYNKQASGKAPERSRRAISAESIQTDNEELVDVSTSAAVSFHMSTTAPATTTATATTTPAPATSDATATATPTP